MKTILNNDMLERILKRISHEIIERNDDLSELVFVGVKRKGVPICDKVKNNIKSIEGIDIPHDYVDISAYRDDSNNGKKSNDFKIDINNKVVVLFDDVFQTGRTIRAALAALFDIGRPKKIQLAVLVDRGHREIPLRADYIGKNVPTSNSEVIIYNVEEGEVYIK